MIRIDEINDAFERMLRSDVKCRFVIDMTSLKNSAFRTFFENVQQGGNALSFNAS